MWVLDHLQVRWWWWWWCVSRTHCRHSRDFNLVRLQKLSTRFLVPFCVILRWTLCDATLERVTVYYVEVMENEIILYEFSSYDLFSEDPKKKKKPLVVWHPLWVWASLLMFWITLRNIVHVTTHLDEWLALRREAEGLTFRNRYPPNTQFYIFFQ
jgi:hypothetical protein